MEPLPAGQEGYPIVFGYEPYGGPDLWTVCIVRESIRFCEPCFERCRGKTRLWGLRYAARDLAT